MANKWNYKISSKDKLDIDAPIAPVDLSSSVIHANKKTTWERIKASLGPLTSTDNIKLGVKYVAFLIPVIVTLYLVNKVYEKQTLNSEAGVGQASLFFQTNSLILPPDADLTVVTNSGGPVGFAKVELSFDPSVVKLVSEIDTSVSPLKKVVKISTMAEANSTGKITVVLGLDPSSLANPPSGSLQLAKFRISSNTLSSNISSSIIFSTTNSQIVNLDQTFFTLTATNLSVLVNPVATSTPNPTTQATITPVSTATGAGKDCSQCHKRRCDNVCDPKRDSGSCPDCI